MLGYVFLDGVPLGMGTDVGVSVTMTAVVYVLMVFPLI